MVEYVLHSYDMNVRFAKRLVKDLTDDQMCEQPHGVVNHPAWSLGHLVVSADRLGQMLGLPSALPAGWAEPFATGGVPSPDRAGFPSRTAILEALEQQHTRNAAALRAADATTLAAPHPNERSRTAFPTIGDYAIFLMTSHEMDHLGQIAAWRRAMGLGAA